MTGRPARGPGRGEETLRRLVAATVEHIRATVEPGTADAELTLPPPGTHPLDDPSFDLDDLLTWHTHPDDHPDADAGDGDGGDDGWPCRGGHWVAFDLGRRRFGTTVLTDGRSFHVAEATFVSWARCKVCRWPVWTITHTSERLTACGWTEPDTDHWRLLTPARARALGAPWPLPWTFTTPQHTTGTPW